MHADDNSHEHVRVRVHGNSDGSDGSDGNSDGHLAPMDVDNETDRLWLLAEAAAFRLHLQTAAGSASTPTQASALAPTATAMTTALTTAPTAPQAAVTALVVDTNFLIAHLKLFKDTLDHLPHPAMVIMVPYIVVVEIDGLKNSTRSNANDRLNRSHADGDARRGERDDRDSVGDWAKRANWLLFDVFKRNDTRMRGQSIDEARANPSWRQQNDDQILDCCLHTKRHLAQHVVLLSDDKNLCVKAMISNIQSVTGFKGDYRDLIAHVQSLTASVNNPHSHSHHQHSQHHPPARHEYQQPLQTRTHQPFQQQDMDHADHDLQASLPGYRAAAQPQPSGHLHPQLSLASSTPDGDVEMDVDMDMEADHVSSRMSTDNDHHTSAIDCETAETVSASKPSSTATATPPGPPLTAHQLAMKAIAQEEAAQLQILERFENLILAHMRTFLPVLYKRALGDDWMAIAGASEPPVEVRQVIDMISKSWTTVFVASGMPLSDTYEARRINQRFGQMAATADAIRRSIRQKRVIFTLGDVRQFLGDMEILACDVVQCAAVPERSQSLPPAAAEIRTAVAQVKSLFK
ncbi:PIN domain-containing protein [Entophlyctis helioformis]|nr:PIN domain-containing protein [Entophlyctis helioformis]